MKRAEDTGRAATNQYFCGDIFTYVPDGRYDVMLFGDSLYYVPWGQILTMLNRYSSYLRENGVFVARVYGRRYQPIIDTIQSHFQVVEKQSYVLPGDEIFVLAFRPRCLENEPS